MTPQIAAEDLLWALVIGLILRDGSHRGVESLAGSVPNVLGLTRSFCNDTLAYFVERLSASNMRRVLAEVIRRCKRNKVFAGARLIGFAIDGSEGSKCSEPGCTLCVPIKDAKKNIVGYRHQFSMISVVATKPSLPFDVEPYGPGDSEYAASQRLLKRAVAHLGSRFADYVSVDGEYSTAPFLHLVSRLQLRVVARLKENLPTLFAEARKRFENRPPTKRFRYEGNRVEIWDADDFDPWDTLNWTTVRVFRYRQHKPDGTVVEAYWLTNFTRAEASSEEVFVCAKNRWEIENRGFNDGKNRYGMEHTHHHEENSLLVGWLLSVLAMLIERLYRCRHLHRGGRPVLSSIELLRTLWIALGEWQAFRKVLAYFNTS